MRVLYEFAINSSKFTNQTIKLLAVSQYFYKYRISEQFIKSGHSQKIRNKNLKNIEIAELLEYFALQKSIRGFSYNQQFLSQTSYLQNITWSCHLQYLAEI